MKCIAKFSDTVTIDGKERDGGRRNDGIPRQMVVTMILNQIALNSIDGGVVSADSLKREKPEFILLANSKADCKQVVTAFNSIFATRDPNKCEKDNYDVTFLHAGQANDNILSTAVTNHIKEVKNKRSSLSRKPLSVNTIMQNQLQSNNAGVIEKRRF